MKRTALYIARLWYALKLIRAVTTALIPLLVLILLLLPYINHKNEKKPSIVHIEPPQEEAKVIVAQDRFRPADEKKITLDPLVLLYTNDSLFTAVLSGEWDGRNARIERGNHEDRSDYRVWMRCEWKSTKPFPKGDEKLYFLANDQPIRVGRFIFVPMYPLEPGDLYIARIMVEVPLNYLERIASAEHAEMKMSQFELAINQKALEKIREFTQKALEIRKEQMAALPELPHIRCN